MIKREFFKTRKDGVNLYRTYSDEGYRIKQIETGNVYDEAIDIENASYNYEETEDKIESNLATEEDYLNALSKLGVK